MTGELGVCITGVFVSVKEARAGLLKLLPDFVIIDFRLPDGTGTELMTSMKEVLPPARWLLYTGAADAFVVRDAIRAGIAGIVSKNEPLSVLIQGAKEVMAGRLFYGPASYIAVQSAMVAYSKIGVLNKTELKIVTYIGQGHALKQVASLSGVATKTVHNYLRSIREKLGVENMVEIAKWAAEHGLAATP